MVGSRYHNLPVTQRDPDVSDLRPSGVSKEIEHLTPVKEKSPKISPPKQVAAGIPAVVSTMYHALSRMGAIKSISNLSKVNRYDGFDCPGCAWPDPDDHRTRFEFCENGAKAVADEGTRERANPAFWSQWSVANLSRKSDRWLNSQGRLTHPMILRPESDNYEEIANIIKQNVLFDYLMKIRSKMIFCKNKQLAKILRRSDHQSILANLQQD